MLAADRAPIWAPPLLALQFLTRIPVPQLARLTQEQANDGLARAMAWLPPVGTIIGGITATTFVVASQIWPPVIAALLALVVEALLTGFFHEDAVADFCDAFGGVAQGERAMQIMHDSRIGSYGTVGLCLSMGLRIAAMVALPAEFAVVAIIAAATFGRLWAVLLASLLPPSHSDGSLASRMGQVIPLQRTIGGVLLAIPGVLPFVLLAPQSFLASLGFGVVFLWWIRRFLLNRIGGCTGDCLGFATYVGQLTLLLGITAQ